MNSNVYTAAAVLYWRNLYRTMRKKPPVTVKYSNVNLEKLDLTELNDYLKSPAYKALKSWSTGTSNPSLKEHLNETTLSWNSTIGELSMTIVATNMDNSSPSLRIKKIRAPVIIQELIDCKYREGMVEFLCDLLKDGETKLETLVEDNAFVSVVTATMTAVLSTIALLSYHFIDK